MHTADIATIDYRPPETVRVCVLRTGDTPEERVGSPLAAVNAEFAQYGIVVEVPWVQPWQRPGFFVGTILEDLLRRPLQPPCDRLVGLIDHPCRGRAVGARGFHHLLGCPHGMTLSKGYPRIAALKQAAMPGKDFFPGIAEHATFLATRAQTQAAIDAHFAEADAKRKRRPAGVSGESAR